MLEKLVDAAKHQVARVLLAGALKLDEGCTIHNVMRLEGLRILQFIATHETSLEELERTMNAAHKSPGSLN